MDEETTGNQRRNERDETNRQANRRNEENSEVMIDEQADALSLTLGLTSYSLQIPSSITSSLRLAQSSPSPRLAQSSLSPCLAQSSPSPRLAQSSPSPRLAQSSLSPCLAQSSTSPRLAQSLLSPRLAQSSLSPCLAQSSLSPCLAQSSLSPRLAQSSLSPRLAQSSPSPRLAQLSPSPASYPLPMITFPSPNYEMINQMLHPPFLINSHQQTVSQGFSPTMAQSGFTPLPNKVTAVRPVIRRLSNHGIPIGNQQPALNQNAVGIHNGIEQPAGDQNAVGIQNGNEQPAGDQNAVGDQLGNQQPAGNQNADVIQPPPYPWATSRRAVIQSLENLEAKGITIITGEVKCKHCENMYQVSYNLREKFEEVENIFRMRITLMRNRAPKMWKIPEPKRCELCGHEKSVKPVIAKRKCQINWLFMLLGQTLGFCKLAQLKNFCKHSKSHRTGAKDRVLYSTYLGLCRMLKPSEELYKVRKTIAR